MRDPGVNPTTDDPPWATAEPPRLGVSSCLLGEEVRHDGGHRRRSFLTEELARYVTWVPVCPEVGIGLGTPRESLRLVQADDGTDDRMVESRSGKDHTGAMRGYARRQVSEAAMTGLAGYVVAAGSPSCGRTGVRVYTGPPDQQQPAHRRGVGLFTRELVARNPLLPVEDDGRLRDPGIREHFVERVFAHAALEQLGRRQWGRGALVDFHTRHKLQLSAHDQGRYRRLGRLVADAVKRDRAGLWEEYATTFCEAMAVRPTRGRRCDTLAHALGHLKPGLDDARRHDLLAHVEAYRRGEVPLSVPLRLFAHHIKADDVGYLRRQTFFTPYPDDLGLANGI